MKKQKLINIAFFIGDRKSITQEELINEMSKSLKAKKETSFIETAPKITIQQFLQK